MDKKYEKRTNVPGGGCSEHAENTVFREKEWYREKIIETIKNTKDLKYLEFIYKLILSFKKKWGV